MRYMFLISSVEDLKPPPARLMEEIDKLSKQPDVASRMVGQGGLFPLSMAGARIRLKGGKLHVMDGPFAETKEQLLGFYVIDVPDLDAAMAVARELSAANPTSCYEIRPVALYVPEQRPDAPTQMVRNY